MMDTDCVLKVENLCKSFGSTRVLFDISFSVKKGETKAFIGPSGTGKSTLLRCINQITEPDSGKVWLDGEEVTNSGPRINFFRQKMGMVFQNFNLFDHLTVQKNVEIALLKVRGMPQAEATKKATFELERVGLADKADCYPAQLSGGQAQRVSIARALAMDPDVMLFDEPTSALDPELTREVLEVIRMLSRQGMTMLIVTHEMRFALSVANEVLFMENGTIAERGTPDDIVNGPGFERMKKFIGKIEEYR
ncbi:MAG TPA: amino acid ABC transporter ATP-binding protein [Methanoregula sp.]|nr:amino acid ABC transporter ATP-binding protein [Methanoregula sp.]